MSDPLVISGQKVKTPHEVTIERYNLTKAGRTADGMMHMDLIAKKRRLVVEYEVITEAELKHLLSIIDGSNVFFTVQYQEGQETKSMTCYAGMIPSRVYRREEKRYGQWIWTDISFNLIER